MSDNLFKNQVINLVNRERIIEIASDLIRLESEAVSGNERLAGEYAEGFLKGLGFTVERQYCAENRFNVVACLRGGGEGRTLMYNGHLDVVPPGDPGKWLSEPYCPEVREEKLFGRGSSDMKGSIACALYAAEILVGQQHPLQGSLTFLLDIDEENANLGLRTYLLEPVITPDFVLVGEPTSLELAIGHRGVMAFTVTVTGKSVHAAQGETGRNAVYGALCLADKLKRLNEELSAADHPYIGPGAVQVTMIKGGTAVNTVPGKCTLRIDRRLTRGENRETCSRQLAELLEASRLEAGCEYEFEITTCCPYGFLNEDREEIRILKNCMGEVLETEPVVKGFEAFCEAGLFLEKGIPAIAIGPGSIAQAHNVNEYISVDQLIKGTKLYARLFIDFLEGAL